MMPAVIAVIKRTWHNYMRCKEVAFDATLPLHAMKSEGNKIRIAAVKQ